MKPIAKGQSDFKSVISKNIYVDKTQYLYKLIVEDDEKFVFASRPRRFGKSLTISTLKYLFSGDKETFKGTYIYDTDYDFKKYPILRFDMSNYSAETPDDMGKWLLRQVRELYTEYDIPIDETADFSVAFAALVKALGKEEKVVILIDEYDKPITDNIYKDDAKAFRDVLYKFYQNIKSLEEDIRFAFLTGVSKFSKVSLFSALNNLTDITFTEMYATMFGYTQSELENNFAEYIEEGIKKTRLSREEYLIHLKDQYDGYRFSDYSDTVYNPVSVGTFFYEGGRNFKNYWTETGMSTMLYNISLNIDFSPLEDFSTPFSLDFSSFDILKFSTSQVSKSDLVKLMIQTGYLTFKVENNKTYPIFPNLEVSSSFCSGLLNAYKLCDTDAVLIGGAEAAALFAKGKTGEALEVVKSHFASFPYEVLTKDGNLRESFFQSVFYTFLSTAGRCSLILEDHTSRGSIDFTLKIAKEIYIIEFKLDQDAETALKQIKEKGYAEKFSSGGKRIHLLGINISSELRNISEYQEEVT